MSERRDTIGTQGEQDENDIRKLLLEYKNGEVSEEAVLYRLSREKYMELGYAKLDHNREARTGLPEVVYAEHKETDHLIGIATAWHRDQDQALIFSRLSPENALALQSIYNDFNYNSVSRLGVLGAPVQRREGKISIVTAGTSDFSVAEEAKSMLEALGYTPTSFHDCGVAGLHRLLAQLSPLRESQIIIAVAGMEGALPSVLAGLVKAPVIAVPTSVGYGTHQNGQVPLMAMLNACAPGISVVNIDSGFNAATMAHAIMDQINIAMVQATQARGQI